MRVLIVTDTPDRAHYFQKRYAEIFNASRKSGNIDNIQVVAWEAPIMGYRADLIIVADRGSHWTPQRAERCRHWFETSLLCRLVPQGVIMDFS